MKSSKTILLTGASGVVGSALVPELLNQGFKVITLVHNTLVTHPHVINVKGNVSEPWFGLDLAQLESTSGPIECVIHSAALTHFGKSEEDMHKANVVGTMNAVAVANSLNARLIYVSTAYTHDLKLPEYLKEYSTYCQSKRNAEAHVKAYANDWTIMRPSIVVGDSQTGAISQFQGLHSIVGAILQGYAPVIPAKSDALVDLIPQDVLARAICAIAGRNGMHREYWITQGSAAEKVANIHVMLERFSRSFGYTRAMPKIVDPEVIDRLFIPVFMPSLPKGARKRLKALVDHACYFNMTEPFPSNYGELADEFNLPPLPESEAVILNNMSYWAEQTRYRERAA